MPCRPFQPDRTSFKDTACFADPLCYTIELLKIVELLSHATSWRFQNREGFTWKIPVSMLLFNGVDWITNWNRRHPKKFKETELDWITRERNNSKKRPLNSYTSWAGSRFRGLLSWKCMLCITEKEGWLKGQDSRSQWATEYIFQEISNLSPVRFQNCYSPVPPMFLPFSPFF